MQLYFTVALCSLLTSVFHPISLLSVMGISLHWFPLGEVFFSPLGLILFTDISNLTIFSCNHLSCLSPSNAKLSLFARCSIFKCSTCNVRRHLKLPSLPASYHTQRKTGKEREARIYPPHFNRLSLGTETAQCFSLQRDLSTRIGAVFQV